MAQKQLALLRHAKSSWSNPDLDDHDRPLNSRGRNAATRMGAYLREARIRPDLVLCSSAARTRETLARLDLGRAPDVLVEDELYGATATTLLDRLRRVSDTTRSVLLIGHNPGIHDAAIRLVGDAEGLEEFPTGALADLRLPIRTWEELHPGTARLRALVLPRSLE